MELGFDARVVVERAHANRNLLAVRPLATEQAGAATVQNA